MNNYSTDIEVIKSNIKEIRMGSIKLQNKIQETAIMVMTHHAEENNPTPMNNLISAMGAGLKAKTLIEYMKAFAKADYNEETKKFVHNKKGFFDLDGATACHWVDFKPEPKAKATDFMKQVKTLALKAVKELPEMKQKDQINAANQVLALAKTLNISLEK